MASDFMIALLFGIGIGGWVYAKMYSRSGGNTQSALTVAGGAGFVVFLVVILILGFVFK